MNQFLMFIGTFLLFIIFFVLIDKEYDKLKPEERVRYKDRQEYNIEVWYFAIFFSLMINCLVWGLIW